MQRKNRLSSAAELSEMAKSTNTLATLAAASVSDEDVQETKSEGVSSITCFITAASLSHEIDKFDDSRALIKLGGVCVISHVLMQLEKAGVTTALVIVGVDGAAIKEETKRNRQLYPDLKLDFLDLGPLWRGGHAASILAGRKYALEKAGSDDILICPSDHIYDDHILRDFLWGEQMVGGAATLLVETDLEGMVGLPSTVNHVALRPLHRANHIYQIGKDLSVYSGIDAGLLRCNAKQLFESLDLVSKNMPYYTIGDILQTWASAGVLLMAKTNGRTWFTVETEGEVAFTEESLQKVGSSYTLEDGRTVQIVGLPSRTQKSPDGGDWSEFSVAKWRTAMFTAEAYFSQLFDDTSKFIRHFTKKFRPERTAIIEVGCGTGEALIPHYDDAKYLVGVDFNQQFIDFCNGNIPPSHKDKVRHICGNALQLKTVLQELHPQEWSDWDEMAKVVTCVGNTIGIMPAAIKAAVYNQMAEVAGRTGIAIMVYWNGNKFGDAVQNFYFKNPQLCGEFTGECIDLSTCTLKTGSGYCTHWTTPAEAREIMDKYGMRIVTLQEMGNGVLVAFRNSGPSRTTSQADLTEMA